MRALTPSPCDAHSEINNIVRDLNSRFNLALPVRSRQISPNKVPLDEPNQCFDLIKTCYWSSRAQLYSALETYRSQVEPVPDSERTSYLVRLLKEAQPQRRVIAKFPTHALANPEATALIERLLPKPNAFAGAVSKGPGQFNTFPLAQKLALRPGVLPSGPTVWEEDEFITPPQSPTDTARASTRQRSAYQNREQDVVSESSRSRKRHSDDLLETLRSPKSRKGKDPFPRSRTPPNMDSNAQSGRHWRTLFSVDAHVTSADTSFDTVFTKDEGVQTEQTSFTSTATAPIPDDGGSEYAATSKGLFEAGTKLAASEYFQLANQNPQAPKSRSRIPSSGSLSWTTEMKEEVMALVDDVQAPITPTTFMKNLQISMFPNQQTNDWNVTEHYLVRDFPVTSLFVDDHQEAVSHLPFRVRYECARFAMANGRPVASILPDQDVNQLDYNVFWTHFEALALKLPGLEMPAKSSTSAWIAATGQYQGVSLNGHMTLDLRSNGLFKLTLEPFELDSSCRFQRAFGGDRFLYIKVPRLDLPPPFQTQKSHFKRRFLEWLSAEKTFLGRTWRVIHIENYKTKKSRRRPKKEREFQYRIILFATSGSDILDRVIPPSETSLFYSSKPATSVESLLHWFMPIGKMLHQPFCKTYARLDLGFSRTTPTIVFRPDQVRRVACVLADGSLEDTLFDDPDLDWTNAREPNHTRVMNDGCARISLGACRLIWQKLGSNGPIPSAFQARINGAKGVWVRSAPTDSTFADDNDIWVEINTSQEKFPPHDEDTVAQFDANRWTFEVVGHTKKVVPFSLHLSFIPILIHRGVHDSKIEELTKEVLDAERNELLQSLHDPVAFRCWINAHYSMIEERQRNSDIQWQAGLPRSDVERAIFLLEHGFEPRKLPHLGDLVGKIARDYFSKIVKSISIRINRSTNVIGVADPVGVLRPGEIHLAFSQSMMDQVSGEVASFLRDREAIVTRHPCLRVSDMQKVRAVYKQELAHIVDCVVFPSQGCIPLASKLQGGDYDGDTFWVCWDPAIVSSFMNAPPRLDIPPPEELGIDVEKRIVAQVMPEQNWLAECFAFRCAPDLLAKCTLEHERQSYAESNINAEGVQMLADLHDYLIDSVKAGYRFSEENFKAFMADPRIKHKRPPIPAYKDAMEHGLLFLSDQKQVPQNLEADPRRISKPNLDNDVDHLFFTVIEPHIKQSLKFLTNHLEAGQEPWDRHLIEAFNRELEWSSQDSVVEDELSMLKTSVRAIERHWSTRFSLALKPKEMHASFKDNDLYYKILCECHEQLQALMPTNMDHPIIKRWTLSTVSNDLTEWCLIKASCLYLVFHDKIKFVFPIAGRELAFIKARSTPRTRLMVDRLWAQMKPRKIKASVQDGHDFEAAHMAIDHGWQLSTAEHLNQKLACDEASEAEDDFYSLVESQIDLDD